MSVLINFIPWLCYWVFLSFGAIYLAIWLAFISALFISLNELRKGHSKILTVGTLVFFFLMILMITFTKPSWFWHEINLMGNMALAFITLLSIILRKPFTLQYAMENTPKERWNSPKFIHANFVITWAWLIAFLCMSLPAAAIFLGIESPLWFSWFFSVCCFMGVTVFTNWYKKHRH